MTEQDIKERTYSPAERRSDACIHFAGIVLALMAVPVLITLAAVWRGDVAAVTGAVIYGLSLILMIHCSALYHMVRVPQWRPVFRRMDHTAIFIKIAGTYTPFALLAGSSAMLLTFLWIAAAAGALLKILAPGRFEWVALSLYLGMGWAGAVAGGEMISALSWTGFILILVGGFIYTVGVIFYLWELLPHHNAIWHAFVLVASCVFYAAVIVELIPKAA
ncbi:PAQR family membrane homeostasis protein TrhA [Algicella marina]|uniref:Hly-III family protein n=1 Tax=Algicella marina TaxID=2683284 RepID=A0A6P1SYH5_9RHOB|nr:hemolysin III family protein [Algicella marina]QHQ34585.1 Hly-III family protein [Algicella marina]